MSTQEENDNIIVRLATIDDLPAIFHLGEKVFTSGRLSNLYRSWDEFEVTSLFNLQPEHVLVAELEDQVIGFAIGSLVRKARGAVTYGHLAWLGVDPEFGRTGVGGMLFDNFRKNMEEAGVQTLVVDTQADNQPALEFFREKGFSQPVRHVYMSLPLNKGS